ncbi:MAG: hypothetical protein K2X81_20940 [Candidatus Obscuribacterales bacterium]|nr:hypothetical protein [Candidatus Obscuribacterales bacterium]
MSQATTSKVNLKFFEDAYSSNNVVKNANSWSANDILGNFTIEGAAKAPNTEASEASTALANLINFASRKVS